MKQLSNDSEPTLLKSVLIIMFLIYGTRSLLAVEPDSLFKSDEIINIELRADFSSLQKERIGDATYHDGELIYYEQDGKPKKLSVRLRLRGKFRRDPANCNFPPLALNFKMNEVDNTIFENQDKLKLVTPCQSDSYVLNEYLIYKLYNLVTDNSLKVRLVKVLYFDTGKGKNVFEKFSFFTEPVENVEKRIDALEQNFFISPFELDKENMQKMTVFQYIIGNADWQYSTRHNLLIMQPNDTSLVPYAIPYDFDLSEFVDADYSKEPGVPDYLQPQRRTYKGLCYSDEEYNVIFEFYRKLKPEFESIINNMTFLSKSQKKVKIRYLEYFYKVIDNKALIKKEFIDKCGYKKDNKMIDLLNNML